MAEATGLHALYASPAALDKGGAVGIRLDGNQ